MLSVEKLACAECQQVHIPADESPLLVDAVGTSRQSAHHPIPYGVYSTRSIQNCGQ